LDKLRIRVRHSREPQSLTVHKEFQGGTVA